MSALGQFERLAAGALLAVPIAVVLVFVGATIGVGIAEALISLGVITYDSSIPDSEVDVWFPFAAMGALFGLFAAIVAGQAVVYRKAKRARKEQI